ncbi:MAG TPA: CaiB/BaiF CoA-transferase family protein [Ktedonobacterales bacterium]|jgi:crotonobetainyl-CoA:carnitine CoA-transferase CaiB-like acyl-CoA transferase|nr:CaiB/BaiF CoA-transferase family protein [Ktedonobacterales bacterium]
MAASDDHATTSSHAAPDNALAMYRSSGPLAGVRVLELGSFVAAPATTRTLADFGADVIKVEQPGSGDELRQWGEMVETRTGEVSAWWLTLGRNKRLVSLNLRDPKGQELALRLVRESQIVVENFRPGRLDAWNLSYDRMRNVNPAVVLVRISGYGQTGPGHDRAGYGNVSESMGGLRYVTGFPDRPPVRVGVSLGDMLAAQQAALGAVMALRVAEKTGHGQIVDVAITESVFAMTEGMVTEYAHKGIVRERSGNKLLRAAPSNVYRTRDEKWIAIGGNGENVFRRFTSAMGQPELASDERFRDNRARVANHDALDQIIEAWTSDHSLAEAQAALDAAGVPAGPVMSIADIVNDTQFQARGMIAHIADDRFPQGEVVMPGIVPTLTETPGVVRHAGGEPAQHNNEIYRDLLGLDAEEIKSLADEGVISPPPDEH